MSHQCLRCGKPAADTTAGEWAWRVDNLVGVVRRVPRLKEILEKEGAEAAKEAALLRMVGRSCQFLDHDGTIPPDWAEKLVQDGVCPYCGTGRQ